MLLLAVALPAMAQSDDVRLSTLQQQLDACVATLPSTLRQAFHEPSRRRTVRVSPLSRQAWAACLTRERDVNDWRSIMALRDDLMALIVSAAENQAAVQREAQVIAEQIVTTTRTVSEQYGMVGSPLFNNFLVHLGVKHAGFCYHWTATLAKALKHLPWEYFSRQWGVANLAEVTENNALIILPRGGALTEGLVYDPWRGAGTPYWRSVKDDHYHWTTRYTERNLQHGVGLDVAPE